MKPDLVFVYGTLKRGCGNCGTMEWARGEFVSNATTMECHPLMVEGLPYLLERAGEGYRVRGEIFRIPPKGWFFLDRLEGHPRLYQRKVIQCELENGSTVQAWTYFIQGDLKRFAPLQPVEEYFDKMEMLG
jgi:gamma-glutamylaminecyclotransferase